MSQSTSIFFKNSLKYEETQREYTLKSSGRVILIPKKNIDVAKEKEGNEYEFPMRFRYKVQDIDRKYLDRKDETKIKDKKLRSSRKKLAEFTAKIEREMNELEKKENSFRKHVIESSQFLRTNFTKRERILKKFLYYSENNRKKTEQIDILKENLSYRKKVVDIFAEEIRKHSIYQNFVLKYLDMQNYQSKGFLRNISAFIDAKFVIKEKFQNIMNNLQNARKSVRNFLFHQEETVKFLLLNLIKVINKYDDLKDTENRNFNILLEITCHVDQFSSENFRCLHIIHSIYNTLCKRSYVPVIYPFGDFKNQLLVIKVLLLKRLEIPKKIQKEIMLN